MQINSRRRRKTPTYKLIIWDIEWKIEKAMKNALKAFVSGFPEVMRAIPGLLACTLILMLPLIAFVLMNV